MKIQLHAKAIESFNSKIDEYLYKLEPDKNRKRQQINIESSATHAFISDNVKEKDIIGISSMSYVDQISGKKVERYFNIDNDSMGLGKESYINFQKDIETLYKKEEINKYLSLDFIMECGFGWFEKKYKGLLGKDDHFIGYLIKEAEQAIKKYKVSIPISFLVIQNPFTIGKVTLEYFKKDFYDKYVDGAKLKIQELGDFNSEKFNIFERDFRQKYQGSVFSSTLLEGEKQRCIETALLRTEKSLMVLRFFSPSVFLPQIPSYFGIMGQRTLPSRHVFIFESEIPEIQDSILETRQFWYINKNEFEELKKMPLHIASELIIKENPSEFEDLLLNSISLFERVLTSNFFQDKIVYSLVSIETLLLQSQSEPIQSSVGLRLAFLSEKEPEKRKKVKSLISNAYKIRSSYIHHGKIGEDWQLLERLQHIVWTAIYNTMILKDKFKSQKDFIDYIENIILT